MKYFAGLAFFLISFAVRAETYMVFHYNQTTRVVLSQGNCLVNGLSGNRAAIQRDDGKFLRGCWKLIDNDQHIRIDWENPAKPGDFAVLRVRDFVPVSD